MMQKNQVLKYKRNQFDEIVIGAGPSGLSYSLFSQKRKIIIEKNSSPGGHAGSFKKNGFTFDYGPHILFSKDKDILDFIIKTLKKNVSKCKRKNKIFYKTNLINFPFENDLGSLSAKENFECIRDFLFNKIKFKKAKNLEQWLLNKFGKSICEKYLFPYNEKVWNMKVKNLSMYWASRIPNPPIEDVLKGSLGIKTEGYLHQLYYHYPKEGGYQSICENWAKKQNVIYNSNVTQISKTKKILKITINNKDEYICKRIISTMSIKDLLKKLKFKLPLKIKNYIKSLIINPMFVISFGIKGKDSAKYTAIYFPEKEYPVNRISFPTTFSQKNSPKGHYSIQAEITCKYMSKIWKKKNKEVLNIVENGLLKKKIIKNKKDIILRNIKRIKESYVVYEKNYEKKIDFIRSWFLKNNIVLLGRFSFFEYINIDMAVDRSLEIYKRLNNIKKTKKKILSQALNRYFNE
jgi:protoporphyrinogen oxidase